MSDEQPKSDNPIVTALRSVFGPLIEQTSKLPAPLAYGGYVIIAVLVVTLLGAVVPTTVLYILAAIVLACLAAFVFLEYDARRPKPTAPAPPRTVRDPKSNLRGTAYVVVHRAGDPTSLVGGAQVVLALPEPQIKITQENGSAAFIIPGEFLNRVFPISASKAGYRRPEPTNFRLKDGGCCYIALAPDPNYVAPTAPPTLSADVIRLVQVKPPSAGGAPVSYENTTGRMTLGRNPESDVPFPQDAKNISWDHGVIFLVRNAFRYQHVSDSCDTTLVRRDGNEHWLRAGKNEEVVLANDDKLVIGAYEFMINFNIRGVGRAVYVRTDREDPAQNQIGPS